MAFELQPPYSNALDAVAAKTKGGAVITDQNITINFHPDRFCPPESTILDSIAEDGIIKSQFETGVSNGSVSAYRGGGRWEWESGLFDGAYDSCESFDRPKYGALNLFNWNGGASPRFGSCYFELHPELVERSTFCYPDSFWEPKDFGVGKRYSHLVDLVNNERESDLLDLYIEAQVHGELSVKHHVRTLVLDPSFRGTAVADSANRLSCNQSMIIIKK